MASRVTRHPSGDAPLLWSEHSNKVVLETRQRTQGPAQWREAGASDDPFFCPEVGEKRLSEGVRGRDVGCRPMAGSETRLLGRVSSGLFWHLWLKESRSWHRAFRETGAKTRSSQSPHLRADGYSRPVRKKRCLSLFAPGHHPRALIRAQSRGTRARSLTCAPLTLSPCMLAHSQVLALAGHCAWLLLCF